MRRVELMGSMTMVCAGDSFRGDHNWFVVVVLAKG